jgi:hypothetical protein
MICTYCGTVRNTTASVIVPHLFGDSICPGSGKPGTDETGDRPRVARSKQPYIDGMTRRRIGCLRKNGYRLDVIADMVGLRRRDVWRVIRQG